MRVIANRGQFQGNMMNAPPAAAPNFSVLMSVYAKEDPEYFAIALDSLVRQTAPAGQVVLVCDGPLSSGLDSVIQRFAPCLPLTVIRLPENVGLSHALNVGLPHCVHEWVARFDSDDICEEFRFAKQLEFIGEHPDVDVFGGNILEFTSDSTRPHAVRSIRQTQEAIVHAARFRNPLNHVTVFFRKSVVLGAGGYPHDELNEDYALWVKLMLSGARFGNMAEPLVRARAGVDMVSRRGGWKYLLAEFRLQSRFWKLGFIGTRVYLFNVGIRIAVRLAPNALRRWVYSIVLRARPQNKGVE